MERFESLILNALQTWYLSDSIWLFSVSRFSVMSMRILSSFFEFSMPFYRPRSEPCWNFWVLLAVCYKLILLLFWFFSLNDVMKLLRSIDWLNFSMLSIVDVCASPALKVLDELSHHTLLRYDCYGFELVRGPTQSATRLNLSWSEASSFGMSIRTGIFFFLRLTDTLRSSFAGPTAVVLLDWESLAESRF